jgi:Ca2+-binding RTX toxin-like protein
MPTKSWLLAGAVGIALLALQRPVEVLTGPGSRRRTTLFLAVVLTAIAFAAGTAGAANTVNCGGGPCYGDLYGNDVMYGTGGRDQMFGFAGSDRIYGRGGNDNVYGGGGSDLMVGGPGGDSISALETAGQAPGRDTVKAGGGNDYVQGTDKYKDAIDCGPGRDTVYYDKGLDTVKNCELAYPIK